MKACITTPRLAWYELDLNWLGIRALEKLGLAWDVKVAKVRQPAADGTSDRLIDDAVA